MHSHSINKAVYSPRRARLREKKYFLMTTTEQSHSISSETESNLCLVQRGKILERSSKAHVTALIPSGCVLKYHSTEDGE